MRCAVALVAALAAFALGCGTVKPPAPPGPPPPPPGVTCSTACANGAQLGCDRSPYCTDACNHARAGGLFSIDVACLTAAQTCAEWSACPGGG